MPDNQPLPTPLNQGDFFTLDDWSVLALDGPEALAFAHAQFASDVTSLAVTGWQWSVWLNAKGRVLAVFALVRSGEQSLRLLVPDLPAAELGDALRRFVFRRKVTIAARPDLHACGAFVAPTRASGANAAVDAEGDGLELDFGSAARARTLRIGPEPGTDDADARQAWTVADLHAGLPRLPESQREQWTPQQLGLERLRAYSVSKGCYPGQEIVARTHFLGKAKRELLLLGVDDLVDAGAEVSQEARGLGTVVAAAGHAPRSALAVLPLERGDGPLQVAGQSARVLPVEDGLGR